MTSQPPWGEARPLAGCEVVRQMDDAPAARPAPRRNRPLVVTKVLALNRFLDTCARTLHPSAAMVWLQLLRDERAGTARTAVSDLARRCGQSQRTVKRLLAQLKSRGLLNVVRPGSKDGGPNVYKLRTAKPRKRHR